MPDIASPPPPREPTRALPALAALSTVIPGLSLAVFPITLLAYRRGRSDPTTGLDERAAHIASLTMACIGLGTTALALAALGFG